MKTNLCSILEIEKPIISAPMGGASGPELVAAVSNAGGLGAIPLWGYSADEIPEKIAQLRRLTSRNFAANLNLSFAYQDKLQACIQENIFAVSLFWGHEPAAIKAAKNGGLIVLASVGTADEAKQAVDAGADVIVAQGWEAGGHVWGTVATMALIPAVVDAVDVPVVAAGGIADGRGLAAALMLGASGAWIGTRFLASPEATIHETYRQKILNASESETEWIANLYNIGWPNAPHRTLANSMSKNMKLSGNTLNDNRPNQGKTLGHYASGDRL